MTRVLVTAFGPYGEWSENASWLTLRALAADAPQGVALTTRLYPVDFAVVRERLASDLAQPLDAVLCLGQAPGKGTIRLEQFALNAARGAGEPSDAVRPLEEGGPAAYRSRLPLADWVRGLRAGGFPAELSIHAGDYLCNAAMYWSHYLGEREGVAPSAALVHVPLDPAQVAARGRDLPSLAAETSAEALRRLLVWIAERSPAQPA